MINCHLFNNGNLKIFYSIQAYLDCHLQDFIIRMLKMAISEQRQYKNAIRPNFHLCVLSERNCIGGPSFHTSNIEKKGMT